MIKSQFEKVLEEIELVCNSKTCKGEKRKYMLISAIGSGVVFAPKPLYACEICLECQEIKYKIAYGKK